MSLDENEFSESEAGRRALERVEKPEKRLGLVRKAEEVEWDAIDHASTGE